MWDEITWVGVGVEVGVGGCGGGGDTAQGVKMEPVWIVLSSPSQREQW